MNTNLRHAWGSKLKNGSHVGMIGALQRKEVDIGLSAAFYRTERVPVVDFIVPTFIMRFIIFNSNDCLDILI